MAKKIIIRLKNAKKVFPDKYTKVRPEDLVNLSATKKQYLSRKEQEKLQQVADEIYGGSHGTDWDFIATREGQRIILKS